jgi:hypothetical protein
MYVGMISIAEQPISWWNGATQDEGSTMDEGSMKDNTLFSLPKYISGVAAEYTRQSTIFLI